MTELTELNFIPEEVSGPFRSLLLAIDCWCNNFVRGGRVWSDTFMGGRLKYFNEIYFYYTKMGVEVSSEISQSHL